MTVRARGEDASGFQVQIHTFLFYILYFLNHSSAVYPLPLPTCHFYFFPDLNTHHELNYSTIIIYVSYFLMPPPGGPPADGYLRQLCNPSCTYFITFQCCTPRTSAVTPSDHVVI